jgi:hypothetical protein
MLERLVLWMVSALASMLFLIAGFTFRDLYRRLRSMETFRDEFRQETAIKLATMELTLQNSSKLLESLTQEVRLLTKVVLLSRMSRRASDAIGENHCLESDLEQWADVKQS